jgi:D-aminopeptidase
VPGLGDPQDADGLMMTGMHAASGTDGFIAHTLTSRLASVTVNGRPLTEVELFSASLSPFGIPPLFFSGCPTACTQACKRIPGIHTVAIDKQISPADLDAPRWRRQLATGAAAALSMAAPAPYLPQGPLSAVIRIRDGRRAAARMADAWGFRRTGATVFIDADDMNSLYDSLIRLCYISPWAEKGLPLSLALFNLVGRLGRQWVRRQLKRPAGH